MLTIRKLSSALNSVGYTGVLEFKSASADEISFNFAGQVGVGTVHCLLEDDRWIVFFETKRICTVDNRAEETAW